MRDKTDGHQVAADERVMHLSTENMELLSFETSRKLMTGEAKGFVYLGAFMYVMAAICAVKLVREEVY